MSSTQAYRLEDGTITTKAYVEGPTTTLRYAPIALRDWADALTWRPELSPANPYGALATAFPLSNATAISLSKWSLL
jgi:hypothetical protein